jgi:hypothetical protein
LRRSVSKKVARTALRLRRITAFQRVDYESPLACFLASKDGPGSSARSELSQQQLVADSTHLLFPQLDLDFRYDPSGLSNLSNLSSAQLAILASYLHASPVDPFVVAEGRTLFTARRGNELGADFVKRETLKGEQSRFYQIYLHCCCCFDS